MITWLLKTILCTALLLAMYKLLLEKEKMPRFNRFYLLCSILFSFIVPAITLRSNTPPTAVAAAILSAKDIFPFHAGLQQPATSSSYNFLPALLGSLYTVVTGLLLYRFIKNLRAFSAAIKNNTMVPWHGALLVLTTGKQPPHSFLKYIFIGREDFENGAVEKEIMEHELTHVRQQHSLDVLLLELLCVFAWFNPFLYLYSKAIRLNHEFLADDGVNKVFHNTPAYQQLLLSKISRAGSRQLTSSFNYHVTKKRFTMMTKNTPLAVIVLKQIALLPLLAVAVIAFSAKTYAQYPPQVLKTAQKHIQSAKENAPADIVEAYRSIFSAYDLDTKEGRKQFRKNLSPDDKAKLEQLFKKMSRKQQEEQTVGFEPPPDPLPRITPAQAEFEGYKNSEKYGVWVDEKKIANDALNNYKTTDFDQVFVSRLYGAAKKNVSYQYQVDLMTKEYYRRYYDKTIAKADINIMYIKRSKPQ